jgi:hypothetical protein
VVYYDPETSEARELEIRSADPTAISSTFESPSYRVYFWKRAQAPNPLPEGFREDQLGYTAYEYELAGAHNVGEVIAWADENAGSDRSFTVYAVVDLGVGKALVRLFGIDPTRYTGERQLEWPGQVYT